MGIENPFAPFFENNPFEDLFKSDKPASKPAEKPPAEEAEFEVIEEHKGGQEEKKSEQTAGAEEKEQGV